MYEGAKAMERITFGVKSFIGFATWAHSPPDMHSILLPCVHKDQGPFAPLYTLRFMVVRVTANLQRPMQPFWSIANGFSAGCRPHRLLPRAVKLISSRSSLWIKILKSVAMMNDLLLATGLMHYRRLILQR